MPAKRDAPYRLLLELIRSGEVPHERVPALLLEMPDFAAWYSVRQ